MPLITPPGATFNGGTITGDIEIDTSPADSATIFPLTWHDLARPNAELQIQVGNLGGTDEDVGIGMSSSGTGEASIVGDDGDHDGEWKFQTNGVSNILPRTGYAGTVLNVGVGAVSKLLVAATGGVAFASGVKTGQQLSAALPTVQLVTATGAQIDAASDRETITPCTFNPGAATTATVTVALSPDNVTYSTLGIETAPVGVALDGTIHLVKVRVPAGWYLKLTVNAQAVLGLTTYY